MLAFKKIRNIGSDVEIQYSLMSYGIVCPLLGGTEQLELSDLNLHRRQIKEQEGRKAMLKEANRSGFILFPDPNDVLVGRGWPYQTFSGNKMLGQVVGEFVDRFLNSADNFEKTCINLEVIKTIQERYGGRFLEPTSEGWKVADTGVTRRKVNSAFRSARSSRSPAAAAGVRATPSPADSYFFSQTDFNNRPPSLQNNQREGEVLDHASKRVRYDPNVAA
jgi:hypothetical protein